MHLVSPILETKISIQDQGVMLICDTGMELGEPEDARKSPKRIVLRKKKLIVGFMATIATFRMYGHRDGAQH